MDSKDDVSPYSDSYSFTVAQRTPFSGLMELAYVGNRTKNMLNTTGGFGSNINMVPYGALLKASAGDPANPNGGYDSYRPLAGFQDLSIITHGLYQNYNSLQFTWLRTKGRYNINVNYTFSKSLGIVNPTYDSFNLNNDYGLTANDRRHLFNASYSIELGKLAKTRNKILGGVANGWQLSGMAQVQSGINLPANLTYNYSIDVGGYKMPSNGYTVSARSINGTDSMALRPLVTCNPSGGGGTHQYINGACFALPSTPGVNGPTISPAVYGPAFMNFDLGLFKNFQISESKKIQIRFNGYNFLNHPLWDVRQRRQQHQAGFQSGYRQAVEPGFRHHDRKTGSAHHPDGDQVLLLIATAERKRGGLGHPVCVAGRSSGPICGAAALGYTQD